MEEQPAPVPQTATQAGDIRERWNWVEPSVWSDRMLTALENGVKGNKWFSLTDKVYSVRNLEAAFEKVRGNGGSAGVDNVKIPMLEMFRERFIPRLSDKLRNGEYQVNKIKRVWIPKPGSPEKRPLGIPTVVDRVVQTAIRNTIEPIFEKDFAENSFGFRPGRGCKDALREVDKLLKKGNHFVVDADLKSYFDTIPHDGLMKRVEEKISDGKVLKLIEEYLKQGILDGMKEWSPEKGTPQGAVMSPLLANIYLDPLDHLMKKAGYQMIRYADDFVVLCRSEEEAKQALSIIKKWTEEAELTLHPEKTKIVDASQKGGFDFLGYHFERGYKIPRKKSIDKLKDKIRAKTGRSNGNSLNKIITDVNESLVGWFGYFKHSHIFTFINLDGWIRTRLRSILRKRQKRKGGGWGIAKFNWPNKFFEENGLYSLRNAYLEIVNRREATH